MPGSTATNGVRRTGQALTRAGRQVRAGPPVGAPADEQVRLEALRNLAILDTGPEAAFDDLTALAARLCATPMAVVSLVDSDRIWFKSRVGIDLAQVGREASLSQHALGQPDVLIVPDTLADPRFADNPTVRGEPGIRFYAGAPLLTADSVAVGVLCVLDTAPRGLTPAQADDLLLIARQVAGQLELRRQAQALTAQMAAKTLVENELRRSRQLLDAILDHTDVLVHATDLQGRFLLVNAAVEHAVGQPPGAMIGRTGADLPASTTAELFQRNDSLLQRAGAWQQSTDGLELPDGSVRTYRSTRFPLIDEDGHVYAVAGVSTDITELTAVRAEMVESARRFGSLFADSPVAIGLSNEHGVWVEANAAFGRLLGIDAADMVGHSALEFAHPDDHPIIAGAELGQLASPDHVMRAEMRFPRPDGTIRWAWVNVTPTPGPHGEPWTLGVVQDITARKEAETALRRSEEELAAIAAVARCVQSGTDPRPVVVASVRSLSGARRVRLLEVRDRDAWQVTAVDGPPAQGSGPDQPAYPRTDRRSDGSELKCDQVRRTGRAVLIPADAQPAAGPPADGPRTGGSALWQPVVVEGEVIAVLHVTWELAVPGLTDPAVDAVRIMADEAGASLHAAQLRTELERSAATDPLTGALNRRAWAARLPAVTNRAEAVGTPLTVAVVDLDNFKAFNDTFGHAAGDELLRGFAEAVLAQLREGDLFARWGGEEFILALGDCDGPAAEATLQRVRDAVPARQTCSIGHTTWLPGEPMGSCIARADAALYAAKDSGRNRSVAG